jgi:hypothetical protein
MSTTEQIRHSLDVLIEPGSVFEVRILGVPNAGVVSGVFDDRDAAAAAVAEYDDRARGIYVTLQRLDRAEPDNVLHEHASRTTRDENIAAFRWLLIDIDPVRPKETSSSDEEHGAAQQRAIEVVGWLVHDFGISRESIVLGDSGNGAHVLVRLDAAASDSKRIRRALRGIAARWTDKLLNVDTSVHNPSRITKLLGTVTRKGDDSAERPHRRSRIVSSPTTIKVAPSDLLDRLAALAPDELRRDQRAFGTYINSHDSHADAARSWYGIACEVDGLVLKRMSDGKLAVRCPNGGQHTTMSESGTDTVVFPPAAGETLGKLHCSHAHCVDLQHDGWAALLSPAARAAADAEFPPLPPDERARRQRDGTARGQRAGDHRTAGDNLAAPAFHEAALYGLVGRFVRLLAPCTEAHPIALLVSIFSVLAAALGRDVSLQHGSVTVRCALQALIVARTSRGRKGTAEGIARIVAETIAAVAPATAPHPLLAPQASGLASGEGLIWHLRDAVVVRDEKGAAVETDPGVADKRLRVVEEEFASVLRQTKRTASTLSTTLRSVFDSLPSVQTLTKHDSAKSSGPHVCSMSHITAAELRVELSVTEIANGLANRIAVFLVDRACLLPEPPEPNEPELKALAKEACEVLLWARGGKTVRLSPDAIRIWSGERTDKTDGLYALLGHEHHGLVGALSARAETHVLRFALLYAVLDRSLVIEVEHLAAAVALWAYCEESLTRLFGDGVGDAVAQRILDALRAAPDAMTRTEIRDLLGRHKRGEQIDAALADLKQKGLVEDVAAYPPGPEGGRVASRWKACDRSDRSDQTSAAGRFAEVVRSLLSLRSHGHSARPSVGPDLPLHDPTGLNGSASDASTSGPPYADDHPDFRCPEAFGDGDAELPDAVGTADARSGDRR